MLRGKVQEVHALVHAVGEVDAETADEARPAVPRGESWAAQAQAAIVEASEEEEDVGFPEPGDRIQHFAFGLCDVLGVDGERLRIRDVKGGGRVREISTTILTIEAPKLRDGFRVFRLSRGG